MNKLYLSVLSVLLIGALSAQDNDLISKLDCQKSNSVSHHGASEKNITSYTQTNNPYIGYCNFNFLWWKTKETGFAYRYLPEITTFSSRPVGKIPSAKSEFSPGFRAELGFSNIYDWMISGIATFYQNRVTDHVNNGSSIYQIGLDVVNLRNFFRLTYWTGDIAFSNHFALNKTVSILPFIAVRAAQIRYHSDLHISYLSLLANADGIDHANYRRLYNFLGFGPNIGMKGFYEFNNSGVNVFGAVSSSVLYGMVKGKDFSSIPRGGGFDSIVNLRSHFDDLKVNLSMQFGAFWKHYFDNHTRAFIMGINGEANYWWNIRDYYTTTLVIPRTEKSIIFYGLNAFIGCEF
jgi:hypothetical protein